MKKLILIVFLCVFLGGCATTSSGSKFYGIAMNSVSNANDFKIKSYKKGEGVRFTYGIGRMNTDITAWADIREFGSNVRVTNESKTPIPTNYFTDDFKIITYDGTTYNLEKPGIMAYPDNEYINPNQTVRYPIRIPYNLKPEEIAMIVCEFGGLFGGTTIVLKPIPHTE